MVDNIKRIVVAGAGTMGTSIAVIFAQYKYEVALYDISKEALDKGRKLVQANIESLAANNKTNNTEVHF